MDNCVVDSRITCTGQKTRNVGHIKKFFFLIDSHDQLLTEVRIKIKLDKYSYFASRAEAKWEIIVHRKGGREKEGGQLCY